MFARAGQRLSLDPPDPEGRATIGGVLATSDSGPLRHRFGGARDLVLGIQVALPDGTVARAGSRVIKNVAGYDLAKLMCGALGTLGVICEVIVRLHPEPAGTATVIGRGDRADALTRGVSAVRRRPFELEALDVTWRDGAGAVLARTAGRACDAIAETVADVLGTEGLECELVEDDDRLWAEQRTAQRACDGGAIVRVSFPRASLRGCWPPRRGPWREPAPAWPGWRSTPRLTLYSRCGAGSPRGRASCSMRPSRCGRRSIRGGSGTARRRR